MNVVKIEEVGATATEVPTPLGRSRFHTGEFVNFHPNDAVVAMEWAMKRLGLAN